MGDENLEQRVQELEQGQQMLGEEMKAISPVLKEYLDGKFEELGTKFVELASRPDEGEIEQRGFKQGLEEVALAFEKNAVEGEIEPIGRRIYNAFAREGLLKKTEEQVEEVETGEGETEELPEAPYLHILGEKEWEKLSDEERKFYFGWTLGKYARLIEA